MSHQPTNQVQLVSIKKKKTKYKWLTAKQERQKTHNTTKGYDSSGARITKHVNIEQ